MGSLPGTFERVGQRRVRWLCRKAWNVNEMLPNYTINYIQLPKNPRVNIFFAHHKSLKACLPCCLFAAFRCQVISRHYSGWAQCRLWAGPQLPGAVERCGKSKLEMENYSSHEPPKPWTIKGFGHLKTRLFTTKTSKHGRWTYYIPFLP